MRSVGQLVAVASAAFMRWALAPEMEQVEGSRAYFAHELRTLGAMSVPERWGLAGVRPGNSVAGSCWS